MERVTIVGHYIAKIGAIMSRYQSLSSEAAAFQAKSLLMNGACRNARSFARFVATIGLMVITGWLSIGLILSV